jgi:acetoin utilization protein AcuC
MHDAAVLIAGGSVASPRAIARGEVDRAVTFCGGLHHALADDAGGFCVDNGAAPAVAALVQAGLRTVAYVDVDPRVLTVSLYRSLTVRR